jgi:hypothetical protein
VANVCEVDCFPPPRADVKYKWSCTSSPVICLIGMDWDNSTSPSPVYAVVVSQEDSAWLH